MAQKRMLAAQTAAAQDALQETAADGSTPALLKLERGIQFCEEAAQLVLLAEREFDLIEKKYNRLIELKTVFARRALARIHYLLQEGAGAEDSTLELIGLLNNSGKKNALLEDFRDSLYVTAPFSIVGDDSLYNRRQRQENEFVPLCPAGGSVLGDRRFCPEAALYGKTFRNSADSIRKTESFRFRRIRCSQQRIWKSFCLSGRRRPRADRRKTGFCCRRKSIRRTAFPTPVLV